MSSQRSIFIALCHQVCPARATLAAACALVIVEATPAWAQDAADAPATVPAVADESGVPTTDVPELTSKLNEPASSQDVRDQAARRLVSRPSPEARTALRFALGNLQQPAARLAAARALGEASAPDPESAPALFTLLDPQASPALLEAAGRALSLYKDDTQVLTRLISIVKSGGSDSLRVVAARTLGTFVDQRAADVLVQQVDPATQSPAVAAASADALAYMTGITTYAGDAESWRKWWQRSSGLSEEAFRASLLSARAARYDQVRQAGDELADELQRLLADQYRAAPPEQQPDLMLRYLRSAQPAVRVAGAKIQYDNALNSATVEPVKTQLRQMIGDSDVDVRRQVAATLYLINDAAALVPLLTQLAQETDSSVRARIAAALAPIPDPQLRAAPLLIALLDDPALPTVRAAADALREMGEMIRQKNPDNLATRTAARLASTLAGRTSPTAAPELRASLVAAMVPLRQPALIPMLQKMVYARPPETPRVRRSLASALGEMGDPKLANTIVALFDDPDATVVLEAVRSLGKQNAVSSFEYAEKLYKLFEHGSTRPKEVQEEAWAVLSSLLPQAPDNQLPMWAERFRDDPRRRIIVLLQLADRAQKTNIADDIAARRQQIGDAYTDLGDPAGALQYYLDALAHFEAVGNSGQAETLSENYMKSLLDARQYAEALAFYTKQVKSNPGYVGILGPKIRLKADTLVESGEFDNAQRLIDAALKIQPPLPDRFTQPLQELIAVIKKRQNQQNYNHYPENEPQNAALSGLVRVASR